MYQRLGTEKSQQSGNAKEWKREKEHAAGHGLVMSRTRVSNWTTATTDKTVLHFQMLIGNPSFTCIPEQLAIKQRFPCLSLGLMNLREGLPGLKNRVYSQGCQFTTQQSDKEMHRVRSPTEQPRSQWSWESIVVARGRAVLHQLGSSPNPIILGFCGSLVTKAGLITSLATGYQFNLKPFSPLQRSEGWDQKFQSSDHMVGVPANQCPPSDGFQKSPH